MRVSDTESLAAFIVVSLWDVLNYRSVHETALYMHLQVPLFNDPLSDCMLISNSGTGADLHWGSLCEYWKRRQALGRRCAKLELYFTFRTVTVSLVVWGCVSGGDLPSQS